MPVRFEMAQQSDEPALRCLMTEVSLGRMLQVTFRREPDFFLASRVQGRFVQVGVARHSYTGEIIGCATRTVRTGFLNGRVEPVGYIGDLRLTAKYRSGTILARGYQHFRQLHQDGRALLYVTVIFENNRVALQTIASGRAGLPTYHDIGRLLSPAICLTRRRPHLAVSTEIVTGEPRLLPEIVACLNRYGSRRQFAPYYTVEDFLFGDRWLYNVHVENLYIAIRNKRVVGVIGRWDQRSFKQTVIERYDGPLRFLHPIVRLGSALGVCPSLPRPKSPVNACYASFLAADDDDLGVAQALLQRAYNDAVQAGYKYLFIGLHEQDPLVGVLRGYRQVPFTARLFCVYFEDGKAAYERLDNRVPSIEIAML